MRAMGLLVGLLLVSGSAHAKQDIVKDPEGTPLAVIVDCESCPQAKDGETCKSGVENGFQDGAPCGRCLIKANFADAIASPYDLHIFGHLKDEKGEPIVGKFVRMYMPKGWTVQTRSLEGGLFILRMGASLQRKSSKAVALDLGDRRSHRDSKSEEYSLFILRDGYKACTEQK